MSDPRINHKGWVQDLIHRANNFGALFVPPQITPSLVARKLELIEGGEGRSTRMPADLLCGRSSSSDGPLGSGNKQSMETLWGRAS